MMSGVAESSDFFLRQLFKSSGKEQDYLRIEPDNLNSIQESLDAANESNMKRLIALGDRTISEHDAILDSMVDFLIEERKHNGSNSKPWSFLNRDLWS